MNLLKELEVAINASLKAGEILMRYFSEKNYDIKYKSKSGRGSPVTSADVESNEILRDKILSVFPNDGWLSEETVDDMSRLEKQRVWIVDPLDGTNDFLKGVPEFAVSVALVELNKPVLGVVYNPATKELYFGVKGNGSYLLRDYVEEGLRFDSLDEYRNYLIKLGSSIESFDKISIIVSRKEMEKVDFIKDLVEVFGVAKFRESIAYKIVSVAGGWADAVVSVFNKSEWDLAGAHLIAEEAGLKVTDSYGEKIFYNQINVRKSGVIVASDKLHDKILSFIKGTEKGKS
ncbi:MAG: 3'(2'),5'-bisphosphate nucleotidase CysQ [Candidatus Kryptonium sp.]